MEKRFTATRVRATAWMNCAQSMELNAEKPQAIRFRNGKFTRIFIAFPFKSRKYTKTKFKISEN